METGILFDQEIAKRVRDFRNHGLTYEQITEELKKSGVRRANGSSLYPSFLQKIAVEQFPELKKKEFVQKVEVDTGRDETMVSLESVVLDLYKKCSATQKRNILRKIL